MKKSRAGFTLIEGLIIVGILGILASLIVPAIMRTQVHSVENANFDKPFYHYDENAKRGFLEFKVWVNEEKVSATVGLEKVTVKVRDDKKEWTTVNGSYKGPNAQTEWLEIEILVASESQKENWETYLADSQKRARQENFGTPKFVPPPDH